jgi:1,4-alpha-glucan branching enzyme
MRLVRALADGRPAATSRMRAARELLAIQSSDWAFLDQRGQAGDYPFQRVTAHAESLLEAIHSRRPSNPGVRSLAPDLSLAPLMEP